MNEIKQLEQRVEILEDKMDKVLYAFNRVEEGCKTYLESNGKKTKKEIG